MIKNLMISTVFGLLITAPFFSHAGPTYRSTERANQCVQIEPVRPEYSAGRLIAYNATIRNRCSRTINVTFLYGYQKGAILIEPGETEEAVCDRNNMNECGNGSMRWEAEFAD